MDPRLSDARPITFVTEFVCGSCWNTFSREDPGAVVTENHVECPHCGHPNPSSDGVSGVTGKVEQVPGKTDAELLAEDSDTFGFGADDPPSIRTVAPSSPPSAPNAVRAVQAPGAVTAPNSVAAPQAVIAADGDTPPTAVRAPSAVATPTGRVSRPQNTVAYVFGAGPLDSRAVSADDDELSVTTRESTDVGATPQAIRQASSAAATSLSAHDLGPRDTQQQPAADAHALGHDATADLESFATLDDVVEPHAGVPDAELQAALDAVSFDDETAVAPFDEAADAGPFDNDAADDPFAAQLVGERDFGKTLDMDPLPLDDAPVAVDEWKLKAPTGLTYNFHSLDAMLGWAASKSGADMQVSADGEKWHDFGVFLDHVRGGHTAQEALRLVSEDLEVEELRFVGRESGAMQVRSAMDDIAAVDAREVAEHRLNIAPIDYDGTGDVALAGGAGGSESLDSGSAGGSGGRGTANRMTSPVVGVSNRPTEPRVPSGRSPKPSTKSVTKVGAKSDRGAEPPARARKDDASGNTLVIVAVGLALVTLTVVALHFGGIITIPGLP